MPHTSTLKVRPKVGIAYERVRAFCANRARTPFLCRSTDKGRQL